VSVARLARPEIRRLKPYEAAVQVQDTVRLNANEAPWSSEADHFRRPLNRYPEIRPLRLQRELAGRFGCDPDRLLVTRGTSEAIDLLIRVFCRSGTDNIVTSSPTFSMYHHYAEIQDAEVRAVPASRDDDFRLDVDELLSVCDDNSRVVFVCTPSNPTGALVPRETIVELLERRGDRSVIVVDEAYIEFSNSASATELLSRYPNLVVLRTLSKALAFAGLRCGAVMGPVEVISMLNAIQAPYALATPVVECAEDSLAQERLDEAARAVALIVSERERLVTELGSLQFVNRIWPSAANFFLVQVDDVDAVLDACKERQILLRYFGGVLEDCIRITVGTPDENDRLLDALQSIRGSG
jgi:histidinol-phosphate aminotransferase